VFLSTPTTSSPSLSFSIFSALLMLYVLYGLYTPLEDSTGVAFVVFQCHLTEVDLTSLQARPSTNSISALG
jgi:hypothetical protein